MEINVDQNSIVVIDFDKRTVKVVPAIAKQADSDFQMGELCGRTDVVTADKLPLHP